MPTIVTRTLQGPSSESWQGSKGVLRLDWSSGAVRFAVTEHGDADFGKPIIAALEAQKTKHGAITLLGDFSTMPTYDSGLRSELTDWIFSHRAQVKKVHLIAGSKIVTMGITVAGMALGNLITNHNDVATFDREAVTLGLSRVDRKSA